MSYLFTWIGEELTGQMKKYKEAVEETAVYLYPSCLSVSLWKKRGLYKEYKEHL